ncbi:MAG: ABC transporter substrate-binding protein [Minisyncoccota bacterium]
MKSPNIFQFIVLGIFVVLIVFGMLAFSGRISLPTGKQDINYGEVTVWGTFPVNTMQSLIADKLRNERNITITYVEKNKVTFSADLVEALAAGHGPDLFLIAQDEILRNLNKIALIPYESVTERDFKNTFVEEGEMFLRPEGIVALPFTVDPIVMYWNRDILTNALIPAPPTKWSEFYTMVPRVVVRDGKGNISRSFASLGEYRNVSHAKEILSILIMQAGGAIVSSQDGILTANLTTAVDQSAQNPAAQAVNFFTQFSRSDKDSYSWNRSLPFSRSMFEAGDLALYFGYASEYQSIRQKNPHLNFDVAVVPQADQANTKMTFGRVQGFAMVKTSSNLGGAMHAAILLSSSDMVAGVAQSAVLPPVRRDLLAIPSTTAVQSVFYDSALIARAWHDPSPTETDQLFQIMIDDIGADRLKVSQALSVAQSSINNLLQRYR